MTLVFMAHVVLRIFGKLFLMYVETLLLAIVALLHSILRPAASEILKKPKVVASDGFIDVHTVGDDAFEETLIFSKDTTSNLIRGDKPSCNPGYIVSKVSAQINNLHNTTANLKRRNKTNLSVPLAEQEDDSKLT
jgi:hypothetical protein